MQKSVEESMKKIESYNGKCSSNSVVSLDVVVVVVVAKIMWRLPGLLVVGK